MKPPAAQEPPGFRMLTWDEFVRIVPCRACGLPFRGEQPWSAVEKGSR